MYILCEHNVITVTPLTAFWVSSSLLPLHQYCHRGLYNNEVNSGYLTIYPAVFFPSNLICTARALHSGSSLQLHGVAWARRPRVLQLSHQVCQSSPSPRAGQRHNCGPLQVGTAWIWWFIQKYDEPQWRSLAAPQCWCGQNRGVHRSWPPHSARPRPWLCGCLWSGGWTAQREDVHGSESGEFPSN